jgi:outer membrane protein insertion porin family
MMRMNGKKQMRFERLALLCSWTVVFSVLSVGAVFAQTVSVQGNSRVESETIRSYFSSQGGALDSARIDQGIKDLYATGLFSDVRVSKTGNGIVVKVVENNTVNSVQFIGNKKLKSEVLIGEIRTQPGKGFTRAYLDSDADRIREIYRRSGRSNVTVQPSVTQGENGRSNVVFNINEGEKTGISAINFEGNNAYSDGKLRDQMTTSESNWLSWLKSSDIYDADRVNADMELLRRFYLKNGYADFRVLDTDARLDAAKNAYEINVKVSEGEQYRFLSTSVESNIPNVDGKSLERLMKTSSGNVYNAENVEKSMEAITVDLAKRGYAFAQVRPRGVKDTAGKTISVVYVVEEGPRVYIERISIRGNSRTRDDVIRREFDIAEGDAYNRVMMDRAEKRLRNTGFFKDVKITNEPGSAPDRVVVNVNVEDQPTGEFSVAGGYSTMDGVIGEIGVAEKNFLGRGQYVKLAGQFGQRTQGVDFSFTEPYFMGTRVSFGVDAYVKESDLTRYAYYENQLKGGGIRLGLPVNDEFSVGLRYQAFSQDIEIPTQFNNNIAGDGEASLALKEARGDTITSMAGYSLTYDTRDNRFTPTEGIFAEFKQDFAGLGGDSRFIRTTAEGRYYHEIMPEVVGLAKVQAGHIAGIGQDLRVLDHYFMGPALVRGFSPSGLGPRDITPGTDPTKNPLGGTKYAGGTLEVQFPLLGLPKEIGMKGAIFADAGTVWGYDGKRTFCTPVCSTINVWDKSTIRSSVGAGILWNSPLGPIRFDYAYVLSKEQFDRKQAFYFSGGTRF